MSFCDILAQKISFHKLFITMTANIPSFFKFEICMFSKHWSFFDNLRSVVMYFSCFIAAARAYSKKPILGITGVRKGSWVFDFASKIFGCIFIKELKNLK